MIRGWALWAWAACGRVSAQTAAMVMAGRANRIGPRVHRPVGPRLYAQSAPADGCPTRYRTRNVLVSAFDRLPAASVATAVSL